MENKPKLGDILTREQFVEILQEKRAGRTLQSFAKDLGVSFQYLGKVFSGEHNPGHVISKKLGFEQIFCYRRIGRPKPKRNLKQITIQQVAGTIRIGPEKKPKTKVAATAEN